MTLFGTDGIRGRAGVAPLDAPGVRRIAAAFARSLPTAAPRRIAVARDPRQSSPLLHGSVIDGLIGRGVDVLDLGILPTPALSWWLSEVADCAGGVMITASHNPWFDNGLKFFDARGLKLGDDQQGHCERALAKGRFGADLPPGVLRALHGQVKRAYLDSLAPPDGAPILKGRRVVADSASGAGWSLLSEVLLRLGAEVVVIDEQPDGRNINAGCGATSPKAMARRCPIEAAWAGVALDGDGDRLILADERGDLHDGDAVLGFLADQLQRAGQLRGGCVVGTVVSGAGLARFLLERDLELVRGPVGDRRVQATMRSRGANLGGESSGHVLTPDHCPTGDGIRVAVQVLRLAATLDQPLSALLGAVPRFPTAHRHVPAGSRPPLAELAPLQALLQAADNELGSFGARQLLRYSGTEPILRILVEGPDAERVEAWADRIEQTARRCLT